jgi:hypothetical protein
VIDDDEHGGGCGKVAHTVIVIEDSDDETLQPFIFCESVSQQFVPKDFGLLDFKASGGTPYIPEAGGAAPSQAPVDPLLAALLPKCMCQELPDPLEPFNNVEQILAFIEEPRKILKHLTCCWDTTELSAGCCPASFAAFSQTVGTKQRIAARWSQMQLLLKNVSVEDFQTVTARQRFLAWVVFATLGGAFHVPPSQAVDLEALKQMGQEVAVVFIFMHFPTLFPGSPQTLLGPGDESHECFNGFQVHGPREDGYKPSHGHTVWELGKLMLGPEAWKTVIAMDLIPLSFFANAGQCCGFDGEDSTCDNFWMALPSSFHAWYVDNTLSLLKYIAKASSKSPSCPRITMVVSTGRGCREILSSEQYKRLATLDGVSNLHPRNTASDGSSRVTSTPHFSCVTRRQMWRKMTAGESSGAALLAQLVVFAQSVGGSEQGEIVGPKPKIQGNPSS